MVVAPVIVITIVFKYSVVAPVLVLVINVVLVVVVLVRVSVLVPVALVDTGHWTLGLFIYGCFLCCHLLMPGGQ